MEGGQALHDPVVVSSILGLEAIRDCLHQPGRNRVDRLSGGLHHVWVSDHG